MTSSAYDEEATYLSWLEENDLADDRANRNLWETLVMLKNIAKKHFHEQR